MMLLAALLLPRFWSAPVSLVKTLTCKLMSSIRYRARSEARFVLLDHLMRFHNPIVRRSFAPWPGLSAYYQMPPLSQGGHSGC